MKDFNSLDRAYVQQGMIFRRIEGFFDLVRGLVRSFFRGDLREILAETKLSIEFLEWYRQYRQEHEDENRRYIEMERRHLDYERSIFNKEYLKDVCNKDLDLYE